MDIRSSLQQLVYYKKESTTFDALVAVVFENGDGSRCCCHNNDCGEWWNEIKRMSIVVFDSFLIYICNTYIYIYIINVYIE